MEMFNNDLSMLLRRLRTERKMSLREFSEYLNISHAYLNKLERGYDVRTGKPITPTIDTLTKIADGLNIPFKKFMEISGYFGDNSINLKEPSEEQHADIIIEDEITNLILKLSTSDTIYCNEILIESEDTNFIISSLRETLSSLMNKYGK